MDEQEGTIEAHYQIRNELNQILQEDKDRKSLIRLAILRIHSLLGHKQDVSPKKQSGVTPRKKDQLEQLRAQVNEYELNINKLKQEHSTQLKLIQSKLDALKEENSKLKLKVKNQPISQQVVQTRKFSNRKPPSLFNISSSYTGSPKFIPTHSQTITTPIKKASKHHSFTANTTFSPTPQVAQRSISLNSKTPVRNNSPAKFVDKFEKSVSPASSPEFPHRRLKEPQSTASTVPTSAESANRTFTDDDSYTSANSSVSSTVESTVDDKTKLPKKKKKLQLWKSKVEKVSVVSHGLDDDNLNTLNYYQDENFKEDPVSPIKKRSVDYGEELVIQPEVKKAKNVFTIE